MNSTTTNDDGEFRIANLKPGRYTLAAGPTSRSGWMGAPGSRAHEGGYPTLFYPGVSDWTSSTPLDVSPGQQVEALFSMAPEPLFRVSGSITGMGAEPAWAQIQISPRAIDTQNIQVDQQPDGSFETKVPAGSYTIRASGNAPAPFQGELPVTVRSDITGLNLIVAPAPNLPVEIVIQRTAVSVSSHSVPRMLLTRVNVRLHGQASKLPTPDYAFSLGTDKNSEHNIHDVAPGIYSVELNPATPDLYVESAQCGGTDLLRENLTLTPGATTPVRLVLRDDGGTIMGNVVYGGHGSPATVLIIPDRASSRVFPLPVEPDGRFQSPKLAPGDYTVLAFDRISGLEYTNPEVLESYLSYATHASVAANGETGVTVNLVRSGK
jgi:hypothetical protein